MIPYLLVALLVIATVVVLARVLRPKPDPVDSFRRQINALSPEARRPTIDQVRDAAEVSDETETDES
ncbi:MAG: hypothetical protein ACJAR2_001910 [Ilumatobacter sp.]|jgi:hypothetical protein